MTETEDNITNSYCVPCHQWKNKIEYKRKFGTGTIVYAAHQLDLGDKIIIENHPGCEYHGNPYEPWE